MKRLSVVLLFVLAMGCGGDDPPGAAQTPQASAGPLRTEAGVPGPLEPRAESSEEVDEDVHTGQEIFITADGPRPQLLYAHVGAEIRFINETGDRITIEFTNLDWKSKPIAPGAFDSYTPDQAVSIVYRLAGDAKTQGNIQVSPYYEPGETAEPTTE